MNQGALVPELRHGNRIKTIQASLAVEQNTLSLEQVTAVLEEKTVGLPREIPGSAQRILQPMKTGTMAARADK